MDATYYNGPDDREEWPANTGARLYFYSAACDGLVQAIRLAAVSEWQPYLGDTTGYALWQLRHVLKQGRALGLIQTHAELERAA